jgi:hypothetical protein
MMMMTNFELLPSRTESDAYLNDLVAPGATPTAKRFFFRALSIAPDLVGVSYTCITSNTNLEAKLMVS